MDRRCVFAAREADGEWAFYAAGVLREVGSGETLAGVIAAEGRFAEAAAEAGSAMSVVSVPEGWHAGSSRPWPRSVSAMLSSCGRSA